ncbi:hypothetical protein SDC9_174289 [bioreactor metagenome]|uniref:Uncharacterized protein n=1 Tax=bioreactor metagenome TaxID=1076179 RepID=A0A645GTA9_9ZZZZ
MAGLSAVRGKYQVIRSLLLNQRFNQAERIIKVDDPVLHASPWYAAGFAKLQIGAQFYHLQTFLFRCDRQFLRNMVYHYIDVHLILFDITQKIKLFSIGYMARSQYASGTFRIVVIFGNDIQYCFHIAT